MELKVDLPTLAGQNINPETFQRVWNRVMPDQAAPEARNDVSAATIPDTAVPAVPTRPMETSPSSQQTETSGESPTLPDVPNCPALSSIPNCSTLTPVPDCPQETQCPACPETPACPECPESSECPACSETPTCSSCSSLPGETPVLCLGEASQGDSGQLEELMVLARTGALAGQALSRRSNGTCAKTLAALTSDHRQALRRLSAAYFLITGTRYVPKCTAPTLPASLPLALRQQFVWEQRWEQKNRQAAQSTADPCLKELYLELAQEGAFHAGCIRSLLDQM